jgi:L,D-peptidoglycan transpeptidase YkuD (ErfK/YbiS/YcfS/YnhG family)
VNGVGNMTAKTGIKLQGILKIIFCEVQIMKLGIIFLLTCIIGLVNPILSPISASQAMNSNIETNKLYANFDKLDTEQIVVVTTKKDADIQGELAIYEKINGEWEKKIYDIPVVVGKKGLGKTKEGDTKTPVGIYKIGNSFGTVNKPVGLKTPYVKTTSHDYWVDDVSSIFYNKWVNHYFNPKKIWKSYEKLTNSLYKYAAIIKYNDNPIVKGKGSAIFLHVWRNSLSPTAGCIATSEANMLKVLKTMDSSKNPMILISKE